MTSSEQAPAAASSTPPTPAVEGGSRELLRIALPLIVSQSFMTVQVFVDTLLLSHHDTLEMAASFPAVMWFWLFFGLLQVTAGYCSTFVAQYTGANRPHRVGPAVWQGIHFAVMAGLLFLVVVPLAAWMIRLGDHSAELQRLETIYLKCLAFAALPMLVMSAINGFFSGRGNTWTVLVIEVFGTLVNIGFALLLIFGHWGFPEMGIEGAGWATVIGSWASALLALVLFLGKKNRVDFNTLRGWKPERELFVRLMRFGGPAGMQMFLDVLVFTFFVQFVGRLGEAQTGATTLAVRLNMVAFLPMMGLGQAICILVGQRLGADRPDLAEKTAYTGLRWVFCYMLTIAAIYVLFPLTLVELFKPRDNPEAYNAMAKLVPSLLMCVAIYSIAESVNVSFAFALRGAGDTLFVTKLTFLFAWPIMVLPTYIAVRLGWDLLWCWIFATAHIFAMAICFWFRFRGGKWKTMRVIEPGKAEEPVSPDSNPSPVLPAPSVS